MRDNFWERLNEIAEVEIINLFLWIAEEWWTHIWGNVINII